MNLLDRVRHRSSGDDTPAKPSPREAARTAREQAAGEEGVRPTSQAEAEAVAETVPGGQAEKPQEIPAKGWLQIVKRGWREAKDDNVPLLAAGVAFYGFLSIVPAITALVLLYGLVFDASDVKSQINSLGTAVPASARSLLTSQLSTLADKSSGGLGIGLVVSVLVALWSASNGAGNLIKAVNIAYDEKETRGFVKQKALALLVTVGAIVFVVVALALIAVLPGVLNAIGLQGAARFGVQVARWVLLLGAVTFALAVVYRIAPNRDAPKLRWVSVGAGTATVLWIIVSIAFTLYANKGGYGSSYGALAGVVVLLMWLWLTSYAILLGAEINAETEQQTVRDTTKGPAEPIGQRDAYKADTLPG